MYYFGIDLGGTNIAAGIVDEQYQIVKKASVPTLATRPTDEIAQDMADLCLNLAGECGIPLSEIKACGIASPGTVNSETGMVEFSNNIPMHYYPMVEKIKGLLNMEEVYIDNDANAAALGETLAGAAKGAASAVMITLGTGVGGGLVVDGKIYSGVNHAGAELGHMVIEKDGRQCNCGRKGCWETYSSATGLINMTREKLESTKDTVMWDMIEGDLSKISGRTAFNAMKLHNDPAGTEVCETYISYLACGVANVINIFQPEVLCIGGGVSNEGDPLFVPLREQAAKQNFARNSKKQTRIVKAVLGNDAGIIGAAALCMNK